jgi:hypothetical protein
MMRDHCAGRTTLSEAMAPYIKEIISKGTTVVGIDSETDVEALIKAGGGDKKCINEVLLAYREAKQKEREKFALEEAERGYTYQKFKCDQIVVTDDDMMKAAKLRRDLRLAKIADEDEKLLTRTQKEKRFIQGDVADMEARKEGGRLFTKFAQRLEKAELELKKKKEKYAKENKTLAEIIGLVAKEQKKVFTAKNSVETNARILRELTKSIADRKTVSLRHHA